MLETLLATQLLMPPKREEPVHVPISRSVMVSSHTIELDTKLGQEPLRVTFETKGREQHLKQAKRSFKEEYLEKQRIKREKAERLKKQRAAAQAERSRLQRLKEQSLALLKIKKKKAVVAKPMLAKTDVAPNVASAEVTAYYAAPDRMQGGGITATGHNLYQSITFKGYRIVAAPPEIPFGSILEFRMANGQTYQAVVLDRGGRIHNGVFDLALANRQECLSFGRQRGTYRIIGHIDY